QGGQRAQCGFGVVVPVMLLGGAVDLVGVVAVCLSHRGPSFRHQPGSLRPPLPRLMTSTAAAATHWAVALPVDWRSCPARLISPDTPPCAEDSRAMARCSDRSPS